MAENTKLPPETPDWRKVLGITREKPAQIGEPFIEGDEKAAGAAMLVLLAANFFHPNERRTAIINALRESITHKVWMPIASDVQ